MKLLLGLKADWRQNNLYTIEEVVIIILDKYNQDGFRNIILAYCHPENNNNQYYTISSNLSAYMPLHYILIFLSSNLR